MCPASDALESLRSKRKSKRIYGLTFNYLAPLTEGERETLRAEADRRGLLHKFNFSGIGAKGIDCRDAEHQVMEATRRHAFELLKKEFGASARFWRNFWSGPEGADFYWRKAGLGLIITGPINRLQAPGSRRDGRLDKAEQGRELSRYCGGGGRIDKLIGVPYYQVWHNPQKFLALVRSELVASGKYPRLSK